MTYESDGHMGAINSRIVYEVSVDKSPYREYLAVFVGLSAMIGMVWCGMTPIGFGGIGYGQASVSYYFDRDGVGEYETVMLDAARPNGCTLTGLHAA